MKQIHKNTIRFLRISFAFTFLYSTLLYSLVRVFFYEFPFTIGEGIELYGKILLVVWVFIIACKLFVTGIIAVESNLIKRKYKRALYVSFFKTAIIVSATAVLFSTGKPSAQNIYKIREAGNNPCNEYPVEPSTIFWCGFLFK